MLDHLIFKQYSYFRQENVIEAYITKKIILDQKHLVMG